jgi:tricorn protease
LKKIIRALLPFLAISALAVDRSDTRLLTDPAIAGERIVFAYANDLWTASLDGSNVRRLTSYPGVESLPRFSPDGRWIAFSGQYDGNTDVYVVDANGGEPKRLTWHPGEDLVAGFTPAGEVLFTSPRTRHTTRHLQFFTVATTGGAQTRLPIPHGVKAMYAPDGRSIIYNPLSEAFAIWKRYRGGRASRLWIYDVASHAIEEVPQPATRSNDVDGMFTRNGIYFRSDRDGEFNLYTYDRASRRVERVTHHADFPVQHASTDGSRIIYEQAGYLHLLDPVTRQSRRLKIGVPADLIETRPRFVKALKYIRSATISPSGARAAFEIRGEVVTVPAEKGDDRNLTATPGAHERNPAWSPDGRWVAYLSDRSGEYRIVIASSDGRGQPREIPLNGAGFYERMQWSPDGKLISLTDNARTLWIVDVPSGAATRVDSEPVYGPEQSLDAAWSPDSRWLAYTKFTSTFIGQLFLFDVAARKSYPVTDGLSDVSSPAFDPNGKYLYMFASTDAGPVQDWFAQSSADMRATRTVYMAVLPKGHPSPLLRESDEELPASTQTEPAAAKAETPKPASRPSTVVVDFADLQQRIQALPIPAADYSQLQAGPTGQIFFIRTDGNPEQGGSRHLQRFDMKKRKVETVLEGAETYQLTPSGTKLLAKMKDSWSISDVADKVDPSKHKLALDKVSIRIDPRAEWSQMYHEAWRIARDYFYDPGMHGADWSAMRSRYAEFLPHLTSRSDMTRLLRWLGSELVVGHLYVTGGDSMWQNESVPGGLLGADYEIDRNRYRFKKVYGGLNWNPDMRSPLTEPGVDVRAGEYLLAVDGKELKYPEDIYARFEGTAGRIVELTVAATADGQGSRTVNVVPVAEELQLRNRDWVEGNLRRVQKATGNRVAYVYVPNTAGAGHTYFKRYFYPQASKDAIIVDERYNGGGQVADYYIDILRRPVVSFWATRYGADQRTPLAAIPGPKVMIIDETAGSGGDLLPWMFRKFEMGTIVGKRTWGGLVGILGFPPLMDGGGFTAPNLAIWTPEEGFTVENEGVPPDIEVEQTPADLIAGRDPQLEKAIEVAMKQLEANPPLRPVRPPFPTRAKR